MRKIFIYSAFLLSGLFSGQNLKISFESAEGYTTGTLKNQKDWKIWGSAADTDMVVSTEKASDGNWSAKIISNASVKDDYGAESVIPFYPKSEISFDINIDDIGGSDNFAVIYNANYDIIAGINFASLAKIWAYDHSLFNFKETTSTFSKNQWYNIKIELDFSDHTAKYYLNNTMIQSFAIAPSLTEYDTLSFWTDDFGTGFFVDNINVKNLETLAVYDFNKKNNLRIYPNPAAEVVSIESGKLIQSIKLYDVSGNLIASENINKTSAKLNIDKLSNGVYILNITTDDGTVSQKIIKK